MPTLEITTTAGCPLDCTFCPQDAFNAAYPKDGTRRLSLDDFVTVLDKVPRHVRIDFSGMSEPWLNTSCTHMLRYALERGHSVALYTTLVGMKDEDEVLGLCHLWRRSIEAVVIHLPDGSGNMRGFRPTKDYYRVLRAFMGTARGGGFREFRMMSMGAPVTAGLDSDPEAWLEWKPCDRAGALSDEASAPRTEHLTPIGCSYTHAYDHNVLLPNGDVVLCCMDYGLKHRLGNLLDPAMDYYALFASPDLAALRAENMRFGGNSACSICRACDRASRYDVQAGTNQFWEERK